MSLEDNTIVIFNFIYTSLNTTIYSFWPNGLCLRELIWHTKYDPNFSGIFQKNLSQLWKLILLSEFPVTSIFYKNNEGMLNPVNKYPRRKHEILRWEKWENIFSKKNITTGKFRNISSSQKRYIRNVCIPEKSFSWIISSMC